MPQLGSISGAVSDDDNEPPLSPQHNLLTSLGKEIMAKIPGSYVATAAMQDAVNKDRRMSLAEEGDSDRNKEEEDTVAADNSVVPADDFKDDAASSGKDAVSGKSDANLPPRSPRISPRLSFVLENTAVDTTPVSSQQHIKQPYHNETPFIKRVLRSLSCALTSV